MVYTVLIKTVHYLWSGATSISVSTRKQFFGMFLKLTKLEIVKKEAEKQAV